MDRSPTYHKCDLNTNKLAWAELKNLNQMFRKG
jgi:hypothetical protein